MAQPTQSTVHVNRPLTSISIAYAQAAAGFIANKVFRPIPVNKQSDIYFKYRRADFNRIAAKKRADGTESAGSGYNLDQGTYSCDVFALHKDVGDQVRANSDSPLAPDRDATEFVSNNMLLKRDKEWSEAFFQTGVWGTDLTGVAGVPAAGQFLQWNDASSTPIENVDDNITAMKKATGIRPNTLVLGEDTWNKLKRHPDMLDLIKYATRPISIIGIPELAAVWSIDQVLVASAIENTAAEGAAETSDFICDSKSALLCYSEMSPGLYKASAGYSFEWTGLLGGASGGSQMTKFRMDELKSDRVEGEAAYDMAVVAADLGIFFDAAVA